MQCKRSKKQSRGFSVQLSFALWETLLDIFKGNANYTIYKCMAEGEPGKVKCAICLRFSYLLCNVFFFSEKQIKSIGSATTAQIDKTGKETETECMIKQENERGLLSLGGGNV